MIPNTGPEDRATLKSGLSAGPVTVAESLGQLGQLPGPGQADEVTVL